MAILGQYLASLRAANRSSGNCNTREGPWRVYNTIVAGKQPSLLMEGNNDKVYDKKS